MSLTKLTDNLNVIQSLPDKPTQTASQLKEKFDKAGNIIKNHINNTLSSELDTLITNLQNAVQTLQNTVITNRDTLSTNQLDIIYPIGALYMSVNTINPSSLFGGTWEQIKDKFLLSAGDTYTAGNTGGEALHTLNVNEMPSHTHTFSGNSHSHEPDNTSYKFLVSDGNIAVNGTSRSFPPTESNSHHLVYTDEKNTGIYEYNNTSSVTVSGTNSYTGGGQAHNNMPPYLTVYVWKRIA